MTDLNRPDSSNLDCFSAAGLAVVANHVMTGGDPKVLGCTLLASTTYYFPLGSQRSPVPAESPLTSVQVWWAAATTITSVSIETCLFPSTVQGQDWRGPVQVSDFDTTAGFWLLQNPPTAYVPVTSGAVTAMTVSPTATTQGGCEFDIGNFGGRRGRVKVVVGATGGVVRVGVHGKAAA